MKQHGEEEREINANMRQTMRELAVSQLRLAESQIHTDRMISDTDQRISGLAEIQHSTQQKISDLAEMQQSTQQEISELTKVVNNLIKFSSGNGNSRQE